MNSKQIYDFLGENYEEVIDRLYKPELLDRLLTLFKNDKNMSELKNAFQEKDAKKAFLAVHTIKGVALNLGMMKLANVASNLTELLRDGQISEGCDEAYLLLEKEYTNVMNFISQLD